MRFGSRLRSLRATKGLGLRELAQKAKISPAFLSKIESGKEKPPAEKKVRALAKVLDFDPDVLMAESGRLPADVIKIVQKYPQEYLALLRDLRNLDSKELARVRARIPITFMDIPVSPEQMESYSQLFRKGSIQQLEVRLVRDKESSESDRNQPKTESDLQKGEF